MKILYRTNPCWSTSANNQNADNFLIDASVLREHLKDCKKPYGSWYSLVCAADAMHGFSVARFVTTLVVVAALIVISSVVI